MIKSTTQMNAQGDHSVKIKEFSRFHKQTLKPAGMEATNDRK
jgi:hypothetical protein